MNIPFEHNEHSTHGGIGILHKVSLDFILQKILNDSSTFEFAHVFSASRSLHIIAVYRPPPSAANTFTTNAFLTEVDEFFGQVSLLNGHVVILGDFNMHIDLPELPASRQFINLIDGAGFQQHVNSPTHNKTRAYIGPGDFKK